MDYYKQNHELIFVLNNLSIPPKLRLLTKNQLILTVVNSKKITNFQELLKKIILTFHLKKIQITKDKHLISYLLFVTGGNI
jgi:hypothetical protein